MGRQKGLFKISGTLYNTNYYIVKGVGYVRKAGGGFNGATIRQSPRMQKVRENASEFGHCSRVKKAFRLAILPFIEGVKGRLLHSEMVSLFVQIKNFDTVSKLGERRVYFGLQTLEGRTLLANYTYNCLLTEGLKTAAGFDWHTQKLTITDFDMNCLNLPKGTTHISLQLGVLDFDFETLASTLQLSSVSFFDINSRYLSATIRPETQRTPSQTGLALLGMRCYAVVNEIAEELEQGFVLVSSEM